MSPAAIGRTAAAAAVTAILAAAVATASAAAPPPKSLTKKFPLGTQTLCCQSKTQSQSSSQSQTTPGSSSTATAKQSTPPPGKSSTPPATTQSGRRPAATPSRHGGHHTRSWILITLVGSVILFVLGDRLVVRRSRWIRERPRRRVPPALLSLLAPIYRHDDERDAWVLRGVGARFGPVLRPNRYRAKVVKEDLDGPGPNPDRSAPPTTQTPDPFTPADPKRSRRRKDADREPPPLAIRRRSD